MKEYWKVYKTDDSFYKTVKAELPICVFTAYDLDMYNIWGDYIYLYLNEDNCWCIFSPRSPEYFHDNGYKFNGELGLKSIRKQKLKKIKIWQQ